MAGRVSKVSVLLMSANLNETWESDCPHLSTLRDMGYAQNDRSIGGASPKTRGDFLEKIGGRGLMGAYVDGDWMTGEG